MSRPVGFAFALAIMFQVIAGALGPTFALAQQTHVAWDSGFNVTVDGYSFENYGSWSGNPGHCYGVAMTAALFYEGMKERPGQAENTYDISFEDIGKVIHRYQNIQEEVWESQRLALQGSALRTKFDAVEQAVMSGHVMLLGFSLSSAMGGTLGHMTVAYRTQWLDNETARVYAYDPNFCYDGTDSYIQYFTLDFGADTFTYTGNIWAGTYDDYVSLYVVEPQLSKADIFWMEYWWLPWLGSFLAVLAACIILFVLLRRLRQRRQEREIVMRKLNEELVEADVLDTKVNYTPEEVALLGTGEDDKAPEGMVECPHCGTVNESGSGQCRMCATDIPKEPV